MRSALDNRQVGTLVVAPTTITSRPAPGATLGITYSGQFGSGAVDQSFKGTLNVKF